MIMSSLGVGWGSWENRDTAQSIFHTDCHQYFPEIWEMNKAIKLLLLDLFWFLNNIKALIYLG